MLKLLFLLIWISASSSTSPPLNYSLVQSAGKPCPGRDSCRQPSDNSRFLESDWKKRNCLCDNACVMYGDCCIDAPAMDGRTIVDRLESDGFECINLKQYGDIYMRTKCARDWGDDLFPNIKRACEEPPDGVRSTDPFGTTPVSSGESGITYRNYYCAVCNRDTEGGGVKFWQPRLECPTLSGYSSRFKNVSADYVEERLSWDPERRKWGVTVDTGGVPVFHECFVDPAVPDELMSGVRICHGQNMKSDCPSTYPDEDVSSTCGAYMGMVFDSSTTYRNVHCALCNGARVDDLVCLNLAPFGRFNWQQNFNSLAFAVLFDLGGRTSDRVGRVRKCENKADVWDPFFKKCRNVICPEIGHEFVNGHCVEPGTEVETTTEITSTTSTSTTTTTEKEEETSKKNFEVLEEISTEVEELLETTSTRILDEVEEIIYTSPTTEEGSLSENLIEQVVEAVTEGKNVFNASGQEPFIPLSESSGYETSNETTRVEEKRPPKAEISLSPEFLKCPKLSLKPAEFQSLEDVYVVESYDLTFNKSNSNVDAEGNLYICADAISDQTRSSGSVDKFGPELAYVTLIGLGVSIVCLVIHMTVALLAPAELLNLSGKNLYSLCAALLAAYVCFVAAQFKQAEGGCVLLAAFMHYSFLASFAWMLTISYDIWRTLRQASKELRLASGGQWKRFGLYSAFGWLSPLAFTVTAVILDDEKSGDFSPRFGENGVCWFSNKLALIAFFAAPFGVVLSLNIVFFVLSAFSIHETTKDAQGSSKITTTCGPKTNFRLYLRLAVIMGLSWIAGLIAGLADSVSELWYVFVLLNTSQGLFILLSFTCTKKVLNSLKSRFNRSSNDSPVRPSGGGPSSSSASSSGVRSSGIAAVQRHLNLTPRQRPRRSYEVVSEAKKGGRSNADAIEVADSAVMSGSSTTGKKRSLSHHGQKLPHFNVRGKTMYTVSQHQVSNVINQNSFHERYY